MRLTFFACRPRNVNARFEKNDVLSAAPVHIEIVQSNRKQMETTRSDISPKLVEPVDVNVTLKFLELFLLIILPVCLLDAVIL